MKKSVKRLLLGLVFVATMICSFAFMSSAVYVEKVDYLDATYSYSDKITLEWEKVTNPRGYCVYRYDYAKHKWDFIKITTTNYYSDYSIEPGTKYAYKIRAYQKASDGKFYYGAYSPMDIVQSGPEKLVSLKASSIATTSMTLTWKASAGATGYLIYKAAPGEKYSLDGYCHTTTYKLDSLLDNTKYNIRVRAYTKRDGFTSYGELSEMYFVSTKEITPPDKVSGVKAVRVSDCTVNLEWNLTKNTSGYVIYQYVPEDKTFIRIGYNSATDNTFTVTGLKMSTKYYFKVRAYRKDYPNTTYGEPSDNCITTTTVLVAPGKVAGVKATSIDYTTVDLTWDKTTNATGYIVYQNTKDGYVRIAYTTPSNNKYTVKNLEAGTKYDFKIRAYRKNTSNLVYATPSDSLIVTTKIIEKPVQVTNVTATAIGYTELTVNWSKATSATGYVIYQYDFTRSAFERIGYATASQTSFKVKNLDETTMHAFSVRAYNKVADSVVYGDPSAVLWVSTKMTPIKDFDMIKTSDNEYTIQWSKVTGADLYELHAFDEENQKWVSVLATSQNTYYSPYFQNGDATNYRVKALTYDDFGRKVYSEYKYLRATTIPRETAILGSADNSDNGLSLKFETVSEATGYQVYRYNPLSGSWQVLGLSHTPGYDDDHLKETREYTYKVRTYSISGDKVYFSDFSSSVTDFFEIKEEPETVYDDVEALKAKGVLGYLYDPAEQVFYTSGDPWQRNFGFNQLYDIAAPLTLINYDTVRFKFTLDDTDWMIQAWKGQYGLIFYGGEIGVYNKPSDRDNEHYDSAKDEDMLKMSMTFYEKKGTIFNRYWEEQFKRPYGTYWWITGFIPGNTGIFFGDLRVDARITMKSYAMLSGFTGALKEEGFDYEVKGLDVYFTYI